MTAETRAETTPQKSEFTAKLEARWSKGNFVCVGLDSDCDLIPQSVKDRVGKNVGGSLVTDVMFMFNRQIVDATQDLVCAYKPNVAFYEAQGKEGMQALLETISYIKRYYPDIPVILDAKRADIGNTNNGYVKSAFEILDADAITVHPYLGREAMKPFLENKDKGVFVLVKTSNPGSDEFQNLPIGDRMENLYEVVARNIASTWNANGNVGVVVGATYPKELAVVRRIVGDIPILIPGIGAQGGEVEATVKAGKDSKNQGMIINSSRGIIFASKGEDFAEAARKATEKLHAEISQYRV